jgi:calcineurin-like phosphoesterase family protein
MKFLFYRPLKITNDENNILFWSDTHFGHKCTHWNNPLWKMRGFQSVEEHDETLIERWNKSSTIETIFFHLGDFIFGFDSVDRMENILSRLLFKHLYIMPGNHCSGWKQHFERKTTNIWHFNSNKKVFFIPNYVESYINNQPLVLSHFPIVSWNGQGKGSWMLHGHCHNNLHKSEIGPLLYKTKIMDVGVENCSYPISFKAINAYFSQKPTITYDHHNENTLNPF